MVLSVQEGKLQGFVHPDFAQVAVTLQNQLAGLKGAGGAAVAVYHRGEPVADLWAGTRNDAGDPWEEDTLSLSFSTSKAIAATALHILVDRGLIDYDEPVAKYWPEFAQNGKQSITVRQALSHQAGLYALRSYIDSAGRMTDWEHVTEALAAAEPAHEPGQRHGYHAWTFGWLVGELVQRVSKQSFSDFLAQEIAGPLNADGLIIGAPEDVHKRAASTLVRDPLRIERFRLAGKRVERGIRALRLPFSLEAFARSHLPLGIEDFDFDAKETLSAAIPAVNGLFTARSLARFYALMANGGELDGLRLLSKETLEQATEVQSRRRDYALFGTRMHWRLGYHRSFTMRGGIDSSFGHWGANGSCGWADPAQKLAVGFVLNYGMRMRFAYLHTARISTAAYHAARAR